MVARKYLFSLNNLSTFSR